MTLRAAHISIDAGAMYLVHKCSMAFFYADRLQRTTVQLLQQSSLQEEQGFSSGGGITWPEYRAAHMDLPVQEALRRFRAIKRGQNPNTMTGGMHI